MDQVPQCYPSQSCPWGAVLLVAHFNWIRVRWTTSNWHWPSCFRIQVCFPTLHMIDESQNQEKPFSEQILILTNQILPKLARLYWYPLENICCIGRIDVDQTTLTDLIGRWVGANRVFESDWLDSWYKSCQIIWIMDYVLNGVRRMVQSY